MTKSSYSLATCITFLVLALVATSCLDWWLPRKNTAVISGADSKRMESGKESATDVFYIYAVQNNAGRTFHNKDTGFGFPFYLKLNAAELQAEAQRLKDREVLIEYYGRRNKILGSFPNILNIKEYQEGMRTTSWMRGSVFGIWILLLILLFPRFFAFMERNYDKRRN